jgi:mRNA-degrading endonuclease toxin of MazEF toxin-antitoxin module
MATILRGEVRWASLEAASLVIGHEQGNSRPVAILSNSRFNANSQLVIAALVTSRLQPRNSPISIPIRSIRMPQPSWVLASQIRTLSAQRIGELLGTLSEEELTRVYRTVNLIFGVS